MHTGDTMLAEAAQMDEKDLHGLLSSRKGKDTDEEDLLEMRHIRYIHESVIGEMDSLMWDD